VLPHQEVVDLTTAGDDIQDKENDPPPLPKLNVGNSVGSYYLDLLIEEEKKNEGRKKRNEEIKSEQKTKQQKVESLKKLTKVSSAQLAASNHYTLDENVRDLIYEKNAAAEAIQIAANQRKEAAETKKAEHLWTALQKFTACPNGLTVPDLKALVTAATNSTDSPVKKRKEELQQQLYLEP